MLDLLRSPGARREVETRIPVSGLAITTAHVPDGSEAEVDLVAEAIGSQVVVEGRISASWTGDCRRCLEPVTGTLDVEVREIYERNSTEGETYELEADHIDLLPMVRDSLLLALPLAPLCESGCRGPAPDTFPASVEGEAHGDEGSSDDAATPPQRDPRWAGLDDLDLG